jgi:hypothetical protein
MLHNYDRNVPLQKKSVVVSLNGLGAKTNWLAVNRPSWSNYESDSDPDPVLNISPEYTSPNAPPPKISLLCIQSNVNIKIRTTRSKAPANFSPLLVTKPTS